MYYSTRAMKVIFTNTDRTQPAFTRKDSRNSHMSFTHIKEMQPYNAAPADTIALIGRSSPNINHPSDLPYSNYMLTIGDLINIAYHNTPYTFPGVIYQAMMIHDTLIVSVSSPPPPSPRIIIQRC